MGIDQIEVPDSQRAYGYTGNNHTIKTPHVSRLAAEGLVFQNWYSAYHICSPSRAAMMTGRLPIRSGCVPGVFSADAVGGLPANETTMAEALAPHGYRTMAIGKWHLGQRTEFLPTNRGFQSYLGIPFSQDMGLSWWENCVGRENHTAVCNPPPLSPPQGGGRPTPLPLFANLTIIAQPAGLYTIAQRYATAATTFIAHSAAAGDPFLLYLPFNHIHGPSSCSATSCGQSVRGPVGDATQDMDRALGEVMDAIRADKRVSNSTLVFFTSDNGAPQRPGEWAPWSC
jgi:arylsulfatase A